VCVRMYIGVGKSQLLDYVTLCKPKYPTRTRDFIVFLSFQASRPDLSPTRSPIQLASRTLLSGVNWPNHEANRLSPSSAETKNEWH
jgi:hypothetical protein